MNAKGEVINGKLYLVLYRQTENSKTQTCPFCGERHIHGPGDGHRTPHCAAPDSSDYVFGQNVIFRNKAGEIFDAQDGYLVKTLRTSYHSEWECPRVKKPKLRIDGGADSF